MIHHSDGRIQCRVRIEGEFKGEKWAYEDPKDAHGSQWIWPDGDPSTYWWEEGNMACDCNRWMFLPDHLKNQHTSLCGNEITFFSITPIEGNNLPSLILNERP